MTTAPRSSLTGMRAAFLRPITLQSWSHAELAAWVRRIAASPVNTIMLKEQSVSPELVDLCLQEDIAIVSSIACFSDHLGPDRVPSRLRPIDEHGRTFDKMVWYEGVVPTDDTYNAALDDRVHSAATVEGVTGLALDFLRWPLHWTVELRGLTPSPRRGSFDPASLQRFRDWLAERDIDNAGIQVHQSAASAERIQQVLDSGWTQFRCDVISTLATVLVDTIHAAGRWAGVFVAPVPHDARRTHLGQDTGSLGDIADVLLPMSYHGIMHESSAWTLRAADDVAATTDAPQVPAVQATSESAYSGDNDWGPPIDAEEFAGLAADLDRMFGGFFVFPGDALDDERSRLLARALDPQPHSRARRS